MKLADAQILVGQLIDYMAPWCDRIEVAGSIRRQREEVKDLEIVCIPKREEMPVELSLLGDTYTFNHLHALVHEAPFIRWIKPGTSVIETWPIKPEGKYWRGLVREGYFGAVSDVKLDLFLAVPENWGVIYTIRTGSDEFSKALVTHAKHSTPYRVDGGFLVPKASELVAAKPGPDNGPPMPLGIIDCFEEQALFDALRLKWIEPQDRIDEKSLRRLMS